MKRRRNEAEKGKGEISDIQINCSLSHLHDSILVNILLRLSIKTIFVCKCVSKAWHDLISDPDFAKLHFDQAQVYPLLRTLDPRLLSRTLYLVQPDDFERKLDTDSSLIKIKLDSKLKLPLRNIQIILDKQVSQDKNSMKLNMRNHEYEIVNSCNDLLCLSNPSDNEPAIVCNPVTGEFINLPKVRTVNDDYKLHCIGCALGFSPATNQYKVIRMLSNGKTEQNRVMVAEVHILGTETWRVPHFLPKTTCVRSPTYLNGCVYWLYRSRPQYVISFDIEKECFESISIPPPLDCAFGVGMGVLGGELFISAFESHDICFCAMKDNGVKKSWSQFFSFEVGDDEYFPYLPYKPIKYLNNGALLMCDSFLGALIYKDPRKKGLRYLEVRGFKCAIGAIAHIPSFVPLKYALSGHDVKVLNVNSRCAELKLHEEDKDTSIVEKLVGLDMVLKIGTMTLECNRSIVNLLMFISILFIVVK